MTQQDHGLLTTDCAVAGIADASAGIIAPGYNGNCRASLWDASICKWRLAQSPYHSLDVGRSALDVKR